MEAGKELNFKEAGQFMIPLGLATPGEQVKIIKITGLEKVQNRLRDMGFVPDSTIELISVNNYGIICKVKDVRVALNHDLAMKIMV